MWQIQFFIAEIKTIRYYKILRFIGIDTMLRGI